ncbi:protein piccolo-like [Rhincodon typus]|uniref:protein piccolo-like n=1 Tax=Rhincodon typus TaxID=259920 RepID=UPI00202DE550|nr:protein piccolo-like [Rhincodon typus]
MQRALGIDMTTVPSSKPQPLQPKQQEVTLSASQAAKQAPIQQPTAKPEQAKPLSRSGSRKQHLLTKQQSMVASPPLKAKQPSHGPGDAQPRQHAAQKPQPVKLTQQLVDQQKQQDLNKPPQQVSSTAQGAESKQPFLSPQVQEKDSKQPKSVTQDQQLTKKQEDSDIRTQRQQLQKKDDLVPGTKSNTGINSQKQDMTQQKQSVQIQKPVEKSQSPNISPAAPEVTKQPASKVESKAGHPKKEQAKLTQKPPAAKVVPSQIPPETPKAQKPPEQSRRFSLNLGGSAQPLQFQPSTPPETVTGKLFGFGASLFSQASTLISAAPQQHEQHGHTAKQPPQTASKDSMSKDSSVSQQSPKRDIGKKEAKPSAAAGTFEQKAVRAVQDTTDPATMKNAAVVKESKPGAEMVKQTTKPLETEKASPPKSTCPLCKTDLNIGSEAPPNFNICTECKAVVCNLCGFNPMPHLTERLYHTPKGATPHHTPPPPQGTNCEELTPNLRRQR